MITLEELQIHLYKTLQNLYDPNHLRTTPLANLLSVAERTDRPSAVRDQLIEAIEALKPMADTSSNSRAWRIYDILFYSYVQQFSQQEVADQIGLSTRHLRREQHAAINALAEYLWQHFNLGQCADAHPPPYQSQNSNAEIDRELSWVKELSPKDPVNLNQALSSVVKLTRNLVEHYQISLYVNLPDALPDLAVHPTALRQVLISLLTIAIRRSAGGRVNMAVQSSHMETVFYIDGIPAHPTLHTPLKTVYNEDDSIGLEIAHSLVDIWGGTLILPPGVSGFEAKMTLPALACVPVLVIDDNVDTLHLLQRYTSGSRYRIIGTQDPREALLLVKENSPQIIVTDVMMPEIDGWELLAHLRQHFLTACLPIIICTILPQKELALSVGADGFIQKPVSRALFLSALDQQMAQLEVRDHKMHE